MKTVNQMKTVILDVKNGELKVSVFDSDFDCFKKIGDIYEYYIVRNKFKRLVVFSPSEDKFIFEIKEDDEYIEDQLIRQYKQYFESGEFSYKKVS